MGSGGCGAIDEITGDFCSSPLIKAKVELAAKGGGGDYSQKRKFCALLAISHPGRDLFIIQCSDKPYLVYPVGPRRKTSENLSVGYHYFFFGAHLAQPVPLGCTADFERFRPILGPKFNRILCFLVSGFPLDIVKISGHSGKAV